MAAPSAVPSGSAEPYPLVGLEAIYVPLSRTPYPAAKASFLFTTEKIAADCAKIITQKSGLGYAEPDTLEICEGVNIGETDKARTICYQVRGYETHGKRIYATRDLIDKICAALMAVYPEHINAVPIYPETPECSPIVGLEAIYVGLSRHPHEFSMASFVFATEELAAACAEIITQKSGLEYARSDNPDALEVCTGVNLGKTDEARTISYQARQRVLNENSINTTRDLIDKICTTLTTLCPKQINAVPIYAVYT